MTNHAMKSFHVMIKPGGAACNLGCRYCYYLPKEALYPGSRLRMTDQDLDTFTRQYIAAQSSSEVTFAWQGGEPLLMGLDFYQRALHYQQKYARPGMRITNTMQTNGTLINHEWCQFLKKNNFLVGLSLDGPKHIHNTYRLTKSGKGSFEDTFRGWQLLQSYGVETNILCTVHQANQDKALSVYRFFRDDLKAQFIQFIPIVERILPDPTEPGIVKSGASNFQVSDRSVNPLKYGNFLNKIFDEWFRQDVGKVFVQIFDVVLGIWLGYPSEYCVFAPACGTALALEHNGDLYSCDHFVQEEWLIGNITTTPLQDLLLSPKLHQFGQLKRQSLPAVCRNCEFLFACQGGCLKDRCLDPDDADYGINYLCEGYKAFFSHIKQPMQQMVERIRASEAK